MIRKSLAVSIALIIVTPRWAEAPASADEQSCDATVRASADVKDTDIVVTGQRQDDALGKSDEARLGVLGERDILSTPFSVTSFSENLARNTQAISLRDLLTRATRCEATTTTPISMPA